MNGSARKLTALATGQYGFFTAKQAQTLGFTRRMHSYYCKTGKWLKCDNGLFRLPNHENSLEGEFARWTLWSRNHQDQPQGVISHQSALALRALLKPDPAQVHLTVPASFRKAAPPGCVLHKASLNLSFIESRRGFLVTRLLRTLEDLREFLTARGQWEETLAQALAAGQLSREEARELGFAPPLAANGRPPAAGPAPNDSPETAPAKMPEAAPAGAQPAESSPGRTEGATQISERIYQMIFRRTSPQRSARRRAQAGFTLVELLVVIGIISLLAAMLLPVLQKASEAAWTVDCANKFRQVHQLAMQYADNYQDYMIHYNQPDVESPGLPASYWRRILFRMLEPNVPNVSADCIRLMATSANYQLFWCAGYVRSNGRAEHPSGRGSGGLNWYLTGAVSGAVAKPWRKLSQCLGLEEPLLADVGPNDAAHSGGWESNAGACVLKNVDPFAQWTTGYYHNSRTNALYIDGHVAAKSLAQLSPVAADLQNQDNFR